MTAPALPPLPYAAAPVKPRVGGGVPRGPNKVNQTLKRAILIAGEVVGNKIGQKITLETGEEYPQGLEGYLTMVAETDVKSFCSLLGRILPMEVTGGGGGPLEVVFRTVYEESVPLPPGPDRGPG